MDFLKLRICENSVNFTNDNLILTGALINAYSALDIPKQLPPSYLEVGGYHIRPTKPLPEVRFQTITFVMSHSF